MGKSLIVIIKHSTPGDRPPLELRRIRRWGDPVMVDWGFDVHQVGVTNFQAVRTWNDGNRNFGAVANFLYIPHAEVMKVRDLQFAEVTERGEFDEDSKMEWLCSYRGSLYMYNSSADEWETAPSIRWGTVSLGGNLVQVERYETITLSIRGEPKRPYEMARLKGFRRSDWSRPLEQLLAEGLVHRVYCAYRNNGFGDSPKGVCYSPFFSPLDYDFTGPNAYQPTALYLPTIWLED